MWVPLPGIKFRLMSCQNDQMLCDEDSLFGKGRVSFTPKWLNKKGLGHRDKEEDNYDYADGSWWTFREPQQKKVEDHFLLVHVNSGRFVYGNADRDECSLAKSGSKEYEDCYWRPQPGPEDEFQLVNCYKNVKLFLRLHGSPHIGIYGGPEYKDQFFTFHYEKYVIQKMVYHLDCAEIVDKRPKLVAQQTFSNQSSMVQSETFTARYTATKKVSLKHTKGFKFKANMVLALGGGAPFIAGGGLLHLGMEKEHKVSHTEETIDAKEMTHEFPLVVPPCTTLRATAFIDEEVAELPYEMLILFTHANVLVYSYGKWRGLQCLNVFNEIVELPDDELEKDAVTEATGCAESIHISSEKMEVSSHSVSATVSGATTTQN